MNLTRYDGINFKPNTGKINTIPKEVIKRIFEKQISFEEFKEHAKPLQNLVYSLEFEVNNQKIEHNSPDELRKFFKIANVYKKKISYEIQTHLDVVGKNDYSSIQTLGFEGISLAGLTNKSIKAIVPICYSSKRLFPKHKGETLYVPKKPQTIEHAIQIEYDTINGTRREKSAKYDNLALEILKS